MTENSMISLDNCTKVRGIYFTSLNSYPLSRIMIMITFMHKKRHITNHGEK